MNCCGPRRLPIVEALPDPVLKNEEHYCSDEEVMHIIKSGADTREDNIPSRKFKKAKKRGQNYMHLSDLTKR